METLEQRITRHEGKLHTVYRDTLGKHTIGIGRLIDAPGGLSDDEIAYLFANDVANAKEQLADELPWIDSLGEIRCEVLIEMVFQLGINGLLDFSNMLDALKAGNYQAAHDEMLDSLWAKQTPARAQELAQLILKGM